MDANEHFEAVAELFCESTGMLPPGKDDAGAGDYDERVRLWNVFADGRQSVRKVPYLDSRPAAAPKGGD